MKKLGFFSLSAIRELMEAGGIADNVTSIIPFGECFSAEDFLCR